MFGLKGHQAYGLSICSNARAFRSSAAAAANPIRVSPRSRRSACARITFPKSRRSKICSASISPHGRSHEAAS